ncbi:hypothetical protein [uncultured Gammaproteobacteria bacterium]|jgi:hypothetical protein|nr:hypothetical protein [uncultured Gammaproteobacteria bacterium]
MFLQGHLLLIAVFHIPYAQYNRTKITKPKERPGQAHSQCEN